MSETFELFAAAVAAAEQRAPQGEYRAAGNLVVGRPLVIMRAGQPYHPITGKPSSSTPLTVELFDELVATFRAVCRGPSASYTAILDWNHQGDAFSPSKSQRPEGSSAMGEVLDLYRDGDALVMVPAYSPLGVRIVEAHGGSLWTSPAFVTRAAGIVAKDDGRRVGRRMLTSVALTPTPAQPNHAIDRVLLSLDLNTEPGGARKGAPMGVDTKGGSSAGAGTAHDQAAQMPPNGPPGEASEPTLKEALAALEAANKRIEELEAQLGEGGGETDATALSLANREIAKLQGELAKAGELTQRRDADVQILSMQIASFREREKQAEIDALVQSGRIGPSDEDRAMAAAVYDLEQKAVMAHAQQNRLSIDEAAEAQTGCKLFSNLQARPAGYVVPLDKLSTGSAPRAAVEQFSNSEAIAAHCDKLVADGEHKTFDEAFSAFCAEHPEAADAAWGGGL